MASRAVAMANMSATSACPLQRRRQMQARRVCLAPPRANARPNGNNGSGNDNFNVDRRDVLLALGGTAAAAAATVTTPSGLILPAMAAPVAPPDLSKCHTAKTAPEGYNQCCLPYKNEDIVDYDFPNTPLRVRRPAHLVKDDKEYMEKYTTAVRKMKELPSDDPRNFYQQALIHCAYCNEAYDQVGFPNVGLQVHYSWLFLPWHRYYLHFFERILGKMINDDTFTLPYWNFDTEAGMHLPEIFTSDPSSSLYNPNRDTTHYYPAIIDYKYSYGNKLGSNLSGSELVQANLSYMQKTFKNSLQLPELFMGDAVRAGESDGSKGSGGLESIHNAFHQWVGPLASPNNDMGNFATAARDNVFYCLHANVDRLWHLYRNFRGNRVEFNEPDWLDTTFVFCDENKRIVRVKTRDCLNPVKLRFTYEDVPLPWMGSLPVKKAETKTTRALNLVRVDEFGSKPRTLGTEPVRVMVPRPQKNRNKKEKNASVELIQIGDIQATSHGPARFDVYLAKPYGDLAGPDFGEFVGSFVRLRHKMDSDNQSVAPPRGPNVRQTNLKLGLTAILEDIEAEDSEKLVITIVPRGGDITIGSVEIKLVKADSPRLM